MYMESNQFRYFSAITNQPINLQCACNSVLFITKSHSHHCNCSHSNFLFRTAKMGPFFYLLFLVSCHFLSISAAPPVTPPKLDEVCNNVGGWYVTPQLCHSVLDTDPQSQNADLKGIAVIAVNIAAGNATLVLADMKQFLQATSDPIQQKALQTCVQVYTDIIPKLKVAAESIKNNKYSEAGTVLEAAMGVPAKCDDTTGNYPTIRAMVDKVDVSFSNVALVARAVVGYLTNYYSG